MSYETTVRKYLNNLDEYIRRGSETGETTAELSYRPVLDAFLREVSKLYSPNADIIFEPKLQGHAGRPDWRIYNADDLGLYGFVEAKALDPTRPIPIAPYMNQIIKYLSIGYHVILTDGLEFIFFDPHDIETPTHYSLMSKPLRPGVCQEEKIDYLMDGRLRDFFKESGFRHCSEEQLIRELAIRAAQLSECILSLSKAPIGAGLSGEENRTIEILHELRTTLSLHHDPVLQHPTVFADFVAQVLSFGLLYAHRVLENEDGQPKEQYNAIVSFWVDAVYETYTDRLLPFKALIDMLASELSPREESSSQLRCWYDDTMRLLAHVQLHHHQREIPDYHTLYERFLAEFDPKTRIDFGAFYTPHELANFTVRLVSTIIEKKLPGRLLFEEGNKVIDPCCGTGTFIEQLVLQSANGAGIHLIGFEILPAPYALAHYRLAMLHAPETPAHEIDILLTNTLSNDLANEDNDELNGVFHDELRRARDCAQPPIVLVIGNPPSSDSFGPHTTGANFTTIKDLLEDFRPAEAERRARQNTQKQIGNDFMKFLRWAADKVLASEVGAMALVLPSTFAAHPSYLHARKWLTEQFSDFWVLDIDRDLRTGVRSSSLFDTQQGRMLLIATHAGNVPGPLDDRLHYAAVIDKSRTQKKNYLSSERSKEELMALFTQHDIIETTRAFRPSVSVYDREMYARFWAIHPVGRDPSPNERCVFIRHCSGTKLAPTALFIHPKRPMLQRRSQEIGDTSKSYDDLRARWFQGQLKPPAEDKLTPEIRARLRAVSDNSERYRSYAFRPFVSEQLLLDEEVLQLLSRTGGAGTRLRPEVVSAFSDETTVGIAIAPSPIDIGDELHRFVTFCWDMPDNDLCSRGNAHVFCNVFPDYKMRKYEWNPTPRNNISVLLLQSASEVLPEITPTDIVFYVYATLCSGSLLEAFGDAYYTASASENIPRVPLVNDGGAMRFLIDKGRELAQLENPCIDPKSLNLFDSFAELFQDAFNLMRYEIDEGLTEIRLYSERTEPEVTLVGISDELLKLNISGYKVLACWFKFHSYAYTRSEFNQEDFTKLLFLLSALTRQLELIDEIDTVMQRIISGELPLL